ncbi:hypothetical protein [Halosimplex halophilum]|nr:hypothetical protein [Halosimplex halophilum]
MTSDDDRVSDEDELDVPAPDPDLPGKVREDLAEDPEEDEDA